MLAGITDSFWFFINLARFNCKFSLRCMNQTAVLSNICLLSLLWFSIFPIFDFDILRCFPELIASPRSPENCIASPHPQQSQISPEESLKSGAHRHRLLAGYLALLLQIYSAGRRGGGCKKCTHTIWKRNCFYKSNRNRPPQCLANQKKRNALKKRSYYSFTETNKDADGGFQKPGYAPRRITITSQEVKSS